MELEIVLKIFLAALLGAMMGLEREIAKKESGLRTTILIAVGSALVTLLSIKTAEIWKNSDPATLASQLIVAAGLLGAATIIKERFTIQGITTAANILLVSAVGITVGMGYYMTAFVVTLMVLGIVWLLKYISRVLEHQRGMYPYIIITEDRASVLILVKKILTDLGIKYESARMKKSEKGFEIEIALVTSKNKNQAFLEKVMQVPGVKEVVNEHL